jgi:hypothetical protein
MTATCTTAATAGLGLAHVLEIPGKDALDGAEVAAVHHHLYGGFAIVGGVCEIATIVVLLLAAPDRLADDPGVVGGGPRHQLRPRCDRLRMLPAADRRSDPPAA